MTFSTHSILSTHAHKVDFNADGSTDLLWSGPGGTVAAWTMSADGMSFTPGLYTSAAGLTLAGIDDISHDGTSDLIWHDAAGRVQFWSVRDGQLAGVAQGGPAPLEAVGDFNRDGHADLLQHSADGTWMAVAAEPRKIPPFGLGTIAPFSSDYHLTGVGDFDADGRTDILFRGTGDMLLQIPVSVYDRFDTLETAPLHIADPGHDWNVLGIGDFNGDGNADLLWQHDSGMRTMWFSNLGSGGGFVDGGALPDPGPDWSVVGTGDYNNDGFTDLMWRSASQPGLHVEWLMHGTAAVCGAAFNIGSDWSLV